MTRTFLDAGVLIAAARGSGIIPVRAHAILDDPERTFVTSDYIRMEVLPKALYPQNRHLMGIKHNIRPLYALLSASL